MNHAEIGSVPPLTDTGKQSPASCSRFSAQLQSLQPIWCAASRSSQEDAALTGTQLLGYAPSSLEGLTVDVAICDALGDVVIALGPLLCLLNLLAVLCRLGLCRLRGLPAREAGLRSLGLGQKAVQPWADLSKQVTQQMIAVQERRLGGNMVK